MSKISKINKYPLYSLDDITIIPQQTDITHRSECNVYDDLGMLPIFTAPMDSVVSIQNYNTWRKNGINSILPRTIPLEDRVKAMDNHKWVAFGLEEFKKLFIDEYETRENKQSTIDHVCIDIANGHMNILPELIKKAKSLAQWRYGIEIMAGNVASAKSYKILSEAGADYVRIGIGGGACCLTSTHTGVHTPMASLIEACSIKKIFNNLTAKIVADGGINTYARANKALALGADYVMMGTMLAKCLESASPILESIDDFYESDSNRLDEWIDSLTPKHKSNIISYGLTKNIYGMSTETAQKLIDPNAKIHVSEGLERTIPVLYTIEEFVDIFKSHLSSAMSYSNAVTLDDFRMNAIIGLLGGVSSQTYNKANF